jgi:hypothetical protein
LLNTQNTELPVLKRQRRSVQLFQELEDNDWLNLLGNEKNRKTPEKWYEKQKKDWKNWQNIKQT